MAELSFPLGWSTHHTPCIFLQMLVIWVMGESLGLNGSMVLLQNIGLTTTYQCENFSQLSLLWKCGGATLSNSSIVFHSDNSAVVHIINRNTSKDPNLMKLMRRLMVASLLQNNHFNAKHILGLLNIAADLLSRLQISRFWTLYPTMDDNSYPVPQALLHL